MHLKKSLTPHFYDNNTFDGLFKEWETKQRFQLFLSETIDSLRQPRLIPTEFVEVRPLSPPLGLMPILLNSIYGHN